MSVREGEGEGGNGRSALRASVRFVLAAAIALAFLFATLAFIRGLRGQAPTGARARAALAAGRTDDARRLATTASDLTDGEDQEALAVLDELDLARARAYRTPRERAEAVLSVPPRTDAGRRAAEQLFFEDAERAVAAGDGSTIEEIRFAVRAWPNIVLVNAQLVALRDLVVLQRCVKATKLVCAAFFPPPPARHPAVAARVEAFRAQQVAHAAAVFRESQAMLKSKPDPSVAGAAQRDQVLAAAEHVALALPAERVEEITAYAGTHGVEAFHATPSVGSRYR